MNVVEYIEGGHGDFNDDCYSTFTATVKVTFEYEILVDASSYDNAEDLIDEKVSELYELEFDGQTCNDIEWEWA